VQLGLITFADVGSVTPEQRLKNLLEEARLADELGLDVFGVGEHHRPDFAVAAPAVALAAIAAQTERIRLTSAVTVLSSDDPVRVFEEFATVDLISGGRAEIMAGRGSFTESFPLFGYDLEDYDELFVEKLELLLKLVASERVTWSGRHRAPIDDIGIYPRPVQDPLPVWIAVGGTPNSVARAGLLGLPLTLAIIGGDPRRFRPYVDLYKQSLAQFGQLSLPIAAHSPGHVAATDAQAKEELWPHYEAMINRIGRERGWPPATRASFEREAGPDGALCVGSVDTVAAKIERTVKALELARFNIKYSAGTLPHDALMRSIELIGTQLVPRVRERLAA
jgi:probable LLM family oxidoreductase